MQFKEIPRKLIVAKRLAQCLNPALPAGVHQRALDVYSHLLAVLGVRVFIYMGKYTNPLYAARRTQTRPTSMVVRSIPILRIRYHISEGMLISPLY